MLTKKGKYGLKALIHLARVPAGEVAQGAQIAETNDIPRKFLDLILLELRNNGFVRSRKGPGGGYALARPASGYPHWSGHSRARRPPGADSLREPHRLRAV